MSARTWHKGPPPFVGWWNVRIGELGDGMAWRWWGGIRWSQAAMGHWAPDEAACAACRYTQVNNAAIQWSDYWPENARVARVDPRQTIDGVALKPGMKLLRVGAEQPQENGVYLVSSVNWTPAPQAKLSWWRRVVGWVKGVAV